MRQAVVTLVGGRATTAVGPFATAGNRAVTARYLGSTTARPSSSAAATVKVAKARSTVAVRVQPGKVVARRTKPRLTITVRGAGVTPTGRVTVRAGGKTYAGSLRAGTVTITLAKPRKPGTLRATVTYAGSAASLPVATTTAIKVRKK